MDIEEKYKSPKYCKAFLDKINKNIAIINKEIRFMEVCGTHTAALFQTGLRSLLPKNLYHISGPGCPVCVTHEDEIEEIITLAKEENIIIATFGDLIRVPNNEGISLKNADFGLNSRYEIVYSPQDALVLAQNNPTHQIIFIGIGFETTAPIIASVIMQAKMQNLQNFSVLSLHKAISPALKNLLEEDKEKDVKSIDIFLLPGHVACITGIDIFSFIAKDYGKPAIVSGFEAVDITFAIHLALEQIINNKPKLENAYTRVVQDNGNPKAMQILLEVFEQKDAHWRGLGKISKGGYIIKNEYVNFDAKKRFNIEIKQSKPSPCKCGSVLKGHIQPNLCPLFAKACNPQKPLGPCMVSSEGACASYYRFMGI